MQFPNPASGSKYGSSYLSNPPESSKKKSGKDDEVSAPTPGSDDEAMQSELSLASSSQQSNISSFSTSLMSNFGAKKREIELRQQSSAGSVSSSASTSAFSPSSIPSEIPITPTFAEKFWFSFNPESSGAFRPRSTSGLYSLELYSDEEIAFRSMEITTLAMLLCPLKSDRRSALFMIVRGISLAFDDVVKKFHAQGVPDKDLEEIELDCTNDHGGGVLVGSKKLGWTEFNVPSLLKKWNDEHAKSSPHTHKFIKDTD